MPYVGNPLADAFSSREKQDLTGQSGTSFTLTHSVSHANDLSVYINHVRQEPTTAYTVNGTTLTTTGSVAGTDDFYIIYDELALQSISHPSDQALTATSGTFTSGLVGTTATFSGAVSGTTGTFSGALSAKGGAVFNEDSADVDFRVESNDQAYMLFVDAGNNRVGVNAATPLAKLQVEGTTDAELRITRTTANISGASSDQGAVLHLFNDIEFENGYDGNATVGQIIFSSDDGSTGQGIRAKIACSKVSYSHSESLDFYVSPGNTTSGQASATSNTLGKRMTIDYAGRVGVATTPPGAEDTNFKNIHIGDQASYGEYDGGSGYIVKNRYYNGSTWVAKENGAGSAINMDTSGVFHYQYSANVNAGQNATLTTIASILNEYSIFKNTRNSVAQYFQNLHSSSPYGVYIEFPNVTKNNTDHYFLSCVEQGNNRLKIYTAGTVKNSTGTYTSFSDERLKSDIVDAKSQWEDIKALKFKNFIKFDNPDFKQLGLIAQDVEKVCPNLVFETPPEAQEIKHSSEFGTLNEDGEVKEVKSNVKNVKDSILYMKSVKALQEAMERIETLEAKVKALESK